MAKYFGMLGYRELVETAPGVEFPKIIERPYYGEVNRNLRRSQTSTESVNDNFALSNEVSVLLDPYAQENFYNLQYITYMGAKWKVTNVEIRYPRLVLTLGGMYNDDGAEETGDTEDIL